MGHRWAASHKEAVVEGILCKHKYLQERKVDHTGSGNKRITQLVLRLLPSQLAFY